MAASCRKGKLLLPLPLILTLIFFVWIPTFSCVVLASESDPSPNSNPENDPRNQTPFPDNHPDKNVVFQHQIDTLTELVQNLTQLVSRLDSHLADYRSKRGNTDFPDESRNPETMEISESGKEEPFPVQGLKKVLKRKSFWDENFQLVSAVKLKSTPTCLDVFPNRDHDGSSKYFAVGDKTGNLYVFLKGGEVSLEIASDPSSAVTAVVSAVSVFRNETVIATGHDNGAIVIHRVWEMLTGNDWNPLRVEKLGKFENPGGPRVDKLEIHHLGRKRFILATDGFGRIRVLGEDGSLHGTANPSRRPIAFLKQRLLFLTETGAGSLDLRTMRLKETECEGLNNSFVQRYVFDAVDRTKAYGLTLEGDLVHTQLLGDVMNFKCRVRFKKRLDFDQPAVALESIRGYLLIANSEKVFVYNLSTQTYVRASGLRLLFSANLDEISTSFLNNDGKMELLAPLIDGDSERNVLVSFGNGYIAMYRSSLPIFKNELKSILWMSPVLFFLVFLFVAWHFFANKKDALTSWGSDDPFSSSISAGDSLGPEERNFPEGSSGLRSSSRYISPPRFAGGQGNSYRPGNEVDPRFRGELKYRGSHVEGAELKYRRDALFVNDHGQAVDEAR